MNCTLPLDMAPQSHRYSYLARRHASLEAVRDTWLRFELEGVCTAYQRYHWVDLIVRQLLPGKKAELVIVELLCAATLEPVMLFPLMQRRYPGYSEITWLSCDVCDYATPLLARPTVFSKQHAAAVWAAVRSALPPTDRIRIDAIPADLASHVQNPLSRLAGASASDVTAYGIALEGPTETLLKRLCKPAFSNKVGRKWRQLEKLGTVSFEEAQTSEDRDVIFGMLIKQRHRRFRELGRFDLLEHQNYRQFYRDAACMQAQDSAVRMFGLKVDDEWIATFYILVHAGYAHAILLTMDQGRWKRMAPGLLIIARTMEWASRNGLDYFDLSVGNRYYKEQIGAGSRSLLTIDESLTYRGAFVARIHHGVRRARSWAKKQPRLVACVKACRSRLRIIVTALKRGVTGDA